EVAARRRRVPRGRMDGRGSARGNYPHYGGQLPAAPPAAHPNRPHCRDQCLTEGDLSSCRNGARELSHWHCMTNTHATNNGKEIATLSVKSYSMRSEIA